MNHEELRRSVVAELQRHRGGSSQSSEELYVAIGGEKTGLSIDDFKAFLQHSNIPKTHEVEGENVSPRYHAPSVKRKMSRNQKRSSSRSSRGGTPDSTLKRFNPKTEGFMSLFNCARRLHHNSDSGNIAWNEIRNLYRKETNRHLNSEELNLICGTTNQTKHDLLTEKLRTIFETVDSKGLIVRLNTFSTPSPSVISEENDSPASSPVSPQSSNDLEERLQEKRRKITESLIRSGHLRDDGGRLSASLSSEAASVVETEAPPPVEEEVTEVSVEETPVEKVTEEVVSGDVDTPKPAEIEDVSEEQKEPSQSVHTVVTEEKKELEAVEADDIRKNTLETETEEYDNVSNTEAADSVTTEAEETQETTGVDVHSPQQESHTLVSDPDLDECLSSPPVEPDTPPLTTDLSPNVSDNDLKAQLEVSPLTQEVKETETGTTEEQDVAETPKEAEVPQEHVSEIVEAPKEARVVEKIEEVSHVKKSVHFEEVSVDASLEKNVSEIDSSSELAQQVDVTTLEDHEKLPETVDNKEVILGTISTASGESSAIVTTVTTVTTTITPAKMSKLTTEEDVFHNDEPEIDNKQTVGLDMPGSSYKEVYTTHTVDLQGKGQSVNAEVTIALPVVQQECLHVEHEPLDAVEKVAPIPSEERITAEPVPSETSAAVSSLSPQRDLEQRPMTIQPLPSTSTQNPEVASPPKKEKKVRIRLPRRRLFGCCSIF